MTSERMLPAMDIHQYNENHEIQYRMARTRFPTETSNDSFELFVCVYNPDHKISSRQWRSHLRKCKGNYGGRTLTCHFNASHHIPEPEFEWHLMTCPDKHALTQDFVTSSRQLATQVNHNPDWNVPECEEDWDAGI